MQIILTALAVGAAITSAVCAWFAYRHSLKLSTRDKIDLLKADILQVVSPIEGKRLWADAIMKSYRENGNIAAKVECVAPFLESDHTDEEWLILLPAAIEELRKEGYAHLLGNKDIHFTTKK